MRSRVAQPSSGRPSASRTHRAKHAASRSTMPGAERRLRPPAQPRRPPAPRPSEGPVSHGLLLSFLVAERRALRDMRRRADLVGRLALPELRGIGLLGGPAQGRGPPTRRYRRRARILPYRRRLRRRKRTCRARRSAHGAPPQTNSLAGEPNPRIRSPILPTTGRTASNVTAEPAPDPSDHLVRGTTRARRPLTSDSIGPTDYAAHSGRPVHRRPRVDSSRIGRHRAVQVGHPVHRIGARCGGISWGGLRTRASAVGAVGGRAANYGGRADRGSGNTTM